MTDLERLVKRLVAVLSERDPAGVHRPVAVDDIRQRLLPYRLHRSGLQLTSVEDYDLLLLRLLAEEGEYVRTNPPSAAVEARTELTSNNPNVDLVEALGEATVQIGAASLARIAEIAEPESTAPIAGIPLLVDAPAADVPEAQWAPPPAPPPSRAPLLVVAEPVASPQAPPPPPPPPVPEPVEVPQFEALSVDLPTEPVSTPVAGAESCSGCNRSLPVGRPVVYCPFCGTQLGTARCLRCGSDLEPGWRHCISCGAKAGADPVA